MFRFDGSGAFPGSGICQNSPRRSGEGACKEEGTLACSATVVRGPFPVAEFAKIPRVGPGRARARRGNIGMFRYVGSGAFPGSGICQNSLRRSGKGADSNTTRLRAETEVRATVEEIDLRIPPASPSLASVGEKKQTDPAAPAGGETAHFATCLHATSVRPKKPRGQRRRFTLGFRHESTRDGTRPRIMGAHERRH